MAKFNIRVEHEVIEYTIIEVEADSADEALALAQSDDSYQNEVYWELDDYIGDNNFIALDDDYNPIKKA